MRAQATQLIGAMNCEFSRKLMKIPKVCVLCMFPAFTGVHREAGQCAEYLN
jgi:hypothetical protein